MKMKQYKLIKQYQGSPKLGSIAQMYNNEYFCQGFRYSIHSEIVENNPEYWEQIKEYPKIISFKDTLDSEMFILCNDNNFRGERIEFAYFLYDMLYSNRCVTSGDFVIYQVAKSETESFTIGEKVHINICSGMNFQIKKFIYENDKIFVTLQEDILDTPISLDSIEKIKTPVFISDDGVELYEKSKCYLVSKEDYTVYNVIMESNDKKCDKFYYVKSEENVKKFTNDKPTISKNEIIEILNSIKKDCYTSEYIKEIFKEKLGL